MRRKKLEDKEPELFLSRHLSNPLLRKILRESLYTHDPLELGAYLDANPCVGMVLFAAIHKIQEEFTLSKRVVYLDVVPCESGDRKRVELVVNVDGPFNDTCLRINDIDEWLWHSVQQPIQDFHVTYDTPVELPIRTDA